MLRLTLTEKKDLERRLAQWQTPNEMLRLVKDTVNGIGNDVLFNQGGLAFLRDAWIAANFGQIRQAKQVRLVGDNWPDFQLNLDGGTEPFEAVEADDPIRRRGDEYRISTGGDEQDSVEDWAARADQAPDGYRRSAGGRLTSSTAPM